jgi:hypothetical protein
VNVRDVYTEGPWFDYDPMLKAIGKIILKSEIGSYQGYYHVLYKRGRQYGYVEVGWGSCTVCDALQSCATWEALQELADSIEGSVRWGTKEEVRAVIAEHEWYWESERDLKEKKAFYDKAMKILS